MQHIINPAKFDPDKWVIVAIEIRLPITHLKPREPEDDQTPTNMHSFNDSGKFRADH